MTEIEYWLWFASINILPIKKNNLLNAFNEIERIFKANDEELLKVKEINLLDILEIQNSKNIELIKKYETFINKNQIKVININDKEYPLKLRSIYDPPVVLFGKGNLNLLKEKGVAIVGSRLADEYGKKQAYDFAYNLSKSGLTVISGLAKGIDSMAHLRKFKRYWKNNSCNWKWFRYLLS